MVNVMELPFSLLSFSVMDVLEFVTLRFLAGLLEHEAPRALDEARGRGYRLLRHRRIPSSTFAMTPPGGRRYSR